MKLNPDSANHFPLLLVHIFSSFLALATEWLQFLPRLRAKYMHVHRFIGRLYLGCIAAGGMTGLVVGMCTDSYIRQLAFMTLAMPWFITGWKGYSTVRQRGVAEHRLWMLRSYAVTLVAATARIIKCAGRASHGPMLQSGGHPNERCEFDGDEHHGRQFERALD